MIIHRMLIAAFFGLVVLTLAACNPASNAAHSVTIIAPQQDAVVYDEVLSVIGTTDRGAARFRLLLQRDGVVEQQVEVVSDPQGQWMVELLHGYAGQPTPYELVALPPADPTVAQTPQPLTVRRILLAASAYRP